MSPLRTAITASVCALAALAAGAPAAHAGYVYAVDEVYGEPGTSFESDSFVVQYVGLPGENNRVWSRYDRATGTYTLTDTGAIAMLPSPGPFGAGGGEALLICDFEPKKITCRHDGPRHMPSLSLHLQDGNDFGSLTTNAPVSAFLDGRDGNDTLHMDGDEATLIGGPGNDHLRGGAHDDELWGGPGADRIDGAGGTDRAVYDHRALDRGLLGYDADNPTAGVTVTYDDLPNDGMPGERDNVLGSNEQLHGSAFGDVLTGGPGADHLVGHEGDDRIDGAAGDDFLTGYEGSDRLIGGAGRDRVFGGAEWDAPDDDVIELRDGEADVYACGGGADTVEADPFDAPVAAWAVPHCETVSTG